MRTKTQSIEGVRLGPLVTAQMPVPLERAVSKLARLERRSRSSMVRVLVEEALAAREARPQLRQAGGAA